MGEVLVAVTETVYRRLWLAVELVSDDFCEHAIVSFVQLGLVVSWAFVIVSDGRC
jgi:hypothetical protein